MPAFHHRLYTYSFDRLIVPKSSVCLLNLPSSNQTAIIFILSLAMLPWGLQWRGRASIPYRDVVKERWNDHLPISSHKARLGCWIDTGSQTSWSSLTCGEHKMCLHITPCSSCLVLCQNKVGADIPIGNTCKMRVKLNGKGKEPPLNESDNFSLLH